MTKLEDFNRLGFNITWKLIDLGYKRDNVFRDELSAEDIIGFAISMTTEKQNVIGDIFDLACEYVINTEAVDSYVKKLAQKENTDYSIEYRKWRILYVSQHLPKADIDFLKGLLELGDIWAKLNFPSDSPHVFQGISNDISPQKYYTEKNYSNLLCKHIEWINKEIHQIIAMTQHGG